MVEKVDKEFSMRFYQWCLQEAKKEIEQDYPILRKINSSSTLAMIDRLNLLSESDRYFLISSLIKGTHQRYINQELTQEEQDIIKHYQNQDVRVACYTKHLNAFEMGVYNLACQTAAANTREEIKKRYNEIIKLDKKKLKASIEAKLKPICGKVCGRDGSNNWDHCLNYGSYLIETNVDISIRFRCIQYCHAIIADDKNNVILRNGISILRCLGLSSDTPLYGFLASEEEKAAETLAAVCKHFIDALPVLLV